jgi:acyl carrier protein
MGLDIVELFIQMESTFGIDIPNADAEKLTTVGLLYDYIATRFSSANVNSDGGPYSGELWERYLDVIEQELGVARADLRPSARFVQDLGVD